LNENKKREVTLKIDIVNPTIRRDNIATLGINGSIAQGVSSFGGSPVNRIHNINVGAAKFNGVLIEPDAKVSFNTILGDVDASTGYLPELVIKENKTVPEYGGGLCQVGTTFFRAALLAGVPITEREPHAYHVLYYDWPYGPGVDATIYTPHPDVRFRNDTGSWILIQTAVVGNKLYFNFYGTKGGRSITLEGPFTLESNPDGSMKTIFYRHVLENGVEARKDTFASSYDSPAKYPHPTPTAPESSPGQATPPPTG
jgi:vancomycin resistance protein YoaR